MLRFRVSGFPVSVSPTFLILGVFLLNAPLPVIVSFIAAAFASILVHELGHAYAVRAAGGVVQQITLHGLGGATSWIDPEGRVSWSKKIAIAAAGAGLGFVVAGLLFLLVRIGLFGPDASQLIPSPFQVFLGNAVAEGRWGVFFLGAFIWVTIVWGLINWLPIGGLDGWHILSELLEKWMPQRGRMLAGTIGLIVAGVAGWFMYRQGYVFAPLILILFALQAFGSTRASAVRPVAPPSNRSFPDPASGGPSTSDPSPLSPPPDPHQP
ncbi:MAG TPA: site-2 protease family protein [Acidimicrobiia bacterium]|nr:site-2 protease family protein [Acidimicrobiia bacterium]